MSPAPPLADELLGDPLYTRLKQYLIESTGMTYYADKDVDLARRIRRRLSAFSGHDCSSYLDLLQDPCRGPAEMDALIAEVTIGETYFFRHIEHFDALRDIVLPDLIARNGRHRSLRIWCAGCADGAEPYSLSILLRRDLAHLIDGWSVSILGTDINRKCLSAAREGHYEDWSLRATPEHLRQDCFEKKGKHWTIAPDYKVGISFQVHNLMESALPPRYTAPAFDLIICRNVMIYFGLHQTRRIVEHFYACMEPGAWLLVGPSEPNMTCFTSFRAVNAPGVTLYQRAAGTAPECAEMPVFPSLPQFSVPPFQNPDVPATPPAEATPSAVPPDPPKNLPVATVADLQSCADRGDWENAARYGKELLALENLNALVHLHYALVLEQMGDATESERALRRAIYLDRHAALAHYHLGRLLQARGDSRQASRYFDNALKLLESMPGDTVFKEADGITVAELRKMAQWQLCSSGEQT